MLSTTISSTHYRVTMVGRDILEGMLLSQRIEPTDYSHLIVACLLSRPLVHQPRLQGSQKAGRQGRPCVQLQARRRGGDLISSGPGRDGGHLSRSLKATAAAFIRNA